MTTDKKTTIGKFYSVSKGAIEAVAEYERAALVLAYLTLKCGQQKHDNKVVTWGRNKLMNVLGVSQRHAMKLMDELRGIAWGPGHHQTAVVDARDWNAVCTKDELVPIGHPGGGNGSNKVMPPLGDDYIYLPNQLTEKADSKEYSPLGQLSRISDKAVRYHATMLLLALYDHLDMQHFGGADPGETVYIPWRYEGQSYPVSGDYPLTLGYMGKAEKLHFWGVDFRADDSAAWSQSLTTTSWKFIEAITGETAKTGADQFWAAWSALRKLGLAYHAAMVFDADPVKDPDAELLYPLWIFNKAERKRLNDRGSHEGGLAKEVQLMARRTGVDDELEEAVIAVFSAAAGMSDEPMGFFVVAAPSKDAKVFGILRPRFIPNTGDGQAGWASIRDKSARWFDRFQKH
jgi:hypothetical protein